MSVTTVLVPVLESEAEELLAGHAPPELYSRAVRLRREIGRIDVIREELHELLIPRWVRSRPKPRKELPRLLRLFTKPEPPKVSTGYDPFVHIFGRSLPVSGASSKDVAERLTKVLAMDEAALSAAIAEDLRSLDVRAPALFESATAPTLTDLRPRLEALFEAASNVANVRSAYNAIVTLAAWSQPVWRLDGELLRDLVRTVGITVLPARPDALFAELKEQQPSIEAQLKSLPTVIEGFVASAGSYWSSLDVKSVAGSLRLHRSTLAKNAVENAEDEIMTLRNLRLLEEAVFYCEAENLGLAEAAGVEWHDRK